MELGINLQCVSGLIGQSAGEALDVRSSGLGLGLGSLELDLTILNLDLNVEAVAELANVASTLANEVIGVLLRELEAQSETSLLLILLLLFNKGTGLGSERINSGSWSTKSDGSADLGNSDGDLILGTALLLLLDESSKAFVELGRDIKRTSLELFLLVDQLKKVLLSILETLLEGLRLSIGRLVAGKLVRSVRFFRTLEYKKNRNVALRSFRNNEMDTVILPDARGDIVAEVLVKEGINGDGADTRRRAAVDDASNLGLGADGILALARVELPWQSTFLGEGGVDVGVEELLKALNFLALAEITGDVSSVGSSTPRSRSMELGNVQVRHLHVHSKVHGLFKTSLNAIGRSNNSDSVVLLVVGQEDSTASLVEEILDRNTAVANDELVSASLNHELLSLQLLLELSDVALDLGTGLLNSSTITSNLDVAIVLTSGGEDRSLPRVDSNRSRARVERLVSRHPDLDAIVLLQSLNQSILGTREEGVERIWNAADLGLDVGGSLPSDLQDLISGRGSRESVTLDNDIDGSIVILINRLVLLDLWKLDLCASLLLKCLDHGSTSTDDVSTSRLRNQDFDASLVKN